MNKQTLILFFLILLGTQLQGQKRAIDFIVGIENTDHTEKINMEYFDSDGNLTGYQTDVGRKHYRFGIHYNRRIKGRLWLKTGFRFSKLGYIQKEEAYVTSSSNPPLENRIKEYDLSYTDIPLMIRYEILNKKITPFIEVGGSLNFYGKTLKTEKTLDGGNILYESKDSGHDNFPMVFSQNITIGCLYRVTERITAFVQGGYRYYGEIERHLNPDRLKASGLYLGGRWNL